LGLPSGNFWRSFGNVTTTNPGRIACTNLRTFMPDFDLLFRIALQREGSSE